MGHQLTIMTPGGLAMASEEVFALMDACRRAARELDAGAWRLRQLGWSGGGLPGVAAAAGALANARDQCHRLGRNLADLASQAGDQEAWRQQKVRGSADRFLHLAVAAATWSGAGKGEAWVAGMTQPSPAVMPPRSTLRGTEDSAMTDDSAAILLGHAHHPGGVRVERVSQSSSVSPATTMAERVARIPSVSSPVRVEMYQLTDGSRHADVFIAGTVDWGVGTGKAPFDLESNVALVAGLPAASVLATTQAMRQAGVRPGDSVSFVGHSQGGAVAARLAESGVYQTRSLVTVGSPTSTIPVRGRYPAVVIEHSNDIVPRLGGHRLTTQATVVTRDSGHRVTDVIGAHDTSTYRETAHMIDVSTVPELDPSAFIVPGRTGEGQVSVYSTSRQPGPRPPA